MSSPRKRGAVATTVNDAVSSESPSQSASPKKRGRKSTKKDRLSELLKTPEAAPGYDFEKFAERKSPGADVPVRKKLVLKKPSVEEAVGVDEVDGLFGNARKAVQNSRATETNAAEKSAPEKSAVDRPVSYTPIRNKVIEMLEKTDLVKRAAADAKSAEAAEFKALPNASEMKTKLAKCGKLRELQAKLARMQELTKQRESRQQTANESKQQTDKESKQTDTVEADAAEESKPLPAYQRFHTLAVEVPPTLSLPYSYKVLAEFFRGTETITSMLHNRAETCTFAKLKKGVQELVRKTFETKRLGQIKTVYPDAYVYRQERGLPAFPGDKHRKYELTVEPNLIDGSENDPTAAKKCLYNKNGQKMFTGDLVVKRKHFFHYSLVEIVKKRHKEFLASFFPRLACGVNDDKITRWHPKFRVDEVAEVRAAELPQPPTVRVFKTAADVLTEAKSAGKALHPRIEQALAKVAASKVAATKQQLKETSKQTYKPPVAGGAALKGVSASLLERIRAKEAQKMSAQLTRDPRDDEKYAMLQRLPEMAKILRTVFVLEKKPALPVEDVHKKMADSYTSGMTALEVESHMRLIAEILPDWISVVKTHRGSFMKVDKNKDIAALVNKIETAIEKKRLEIA
ncbi:DNA replication factor Cdt1-like [Tubulanus polymorphus]|uniref:DNA replication factor Cdt1-like n=1 Tax=Tubulanus polymorphus TaxID=672921 RepID=UPI003DA5B4D8